MVLLTNNQEKESSESSIIDRHRELRNWELKEVIYTYCK